MRMVPGIFCPRTINMIVLSFVFTGMVMRFDLKVMTGTSRAPSSSSSSANW
jgi:hypothetical protein